METKKSKYDTNPLDPDVERKADESWGGPPTQQVRGATREVGRNANENARQNAYSESPTRRYDRPPLDSSYASVFVPPPTDVSPTHYQQPAADAYPTPITSPTTSLTVMGRGRPET